MTQSYNDIVKTCDLLEYKFEPHAHGDRYIEIWVNATDTFKAIFLANRNSLLPITYFKVTYE